MEFRITIHYDEKLQRDVQDALEQIEVLSLLSSGTGIGIRIRIGIHIHIHNKHSLTHAHTRAHEHVLKGTYHVPAYVCCLLVCLSRLLMRFAADSAAQEEATSVKPESLTRRRSEPPPAWCTCTDYGKRSNFCFCNSGARTSLAVCDKWVSEAPEYRDVRLPSSFSKTPGYVWELHANQVGCLHVNQRRLANADEHPLVCGAVCQQCWPDACF
jgi:hypothetical protein